MSRKTFPYFQTWNASQPIGGGFESYRVKSHRCTRQDCIPLEMYGLVAPKRAWPEPLWRVCWPFLVDTLIWNLFAIINYSFNLYQDSYDFLANSLYIYDVLTCSSLKTDYYPWTYFPCGTQMVYLIALIDSLRQKSISADNYVVFAEMFYFAFGFATFASSK